MKKMAVAAAAAMMLCGSANAAVTVDIVQNGTSVVATGRGSIDTDGLRTTGGGSGPGFIAPASGTLILGGTSSQNFAIYSGISGPSKFGTTAASTLSSLGSGKLFGLFANYGPGLNYSLALPVDYVSGMALFATSVYDNASLASLGLTPGTYVYLAPHDAFTINIGAAVAAVPEPATWGMMILGMGAVGLALRRRQKVTKRVSFT